MTTRMTTIPRSPLAASLAAIAGLAIASSAARGQTITESADVPSSLPGQVTTGTGSLTRINGSIVSIVDSADIYLIRITDRASFSAAVVSENNLFRPQAFLLDASGRPITHMTAPNSGPGQTATLTGQFVPSPGLYYLIVTSSNSDPISTGNLLMWNDAPVGVERAPDGPGAAGTFGGFSGAVQAAGSYHVTLAGVSYAVETAPACSPAFSALNSYGTFSQPYAIATGDFTGDGKPDIMTTDFGSGGVFLFAGRGDGTFSAGNYTATYNNPQALAAGDFNRDGKLDVVVANYGALFASVLRSNGTGGLLVPIDVNVGLNCTGVAVADFNGDGRMDIALSREPGFAVVSLGVGDNAFGAATSLSVTGQLSAVAAGDVNGDGKQDIVCADFSGSVVRVLIGNGDGTFQAPVAYATGAGPNSVSIADVNGDGRADMVVSCGGANTVTVLLGGSAGGFPTRLSFSDASGALVNAVVTDIDTDGKLDIVTGHLAPGATSVLRGRGDGTFCASAQYQPASGRVAVGDFNRDGLPDFATAATGNNQMQASVQLHGGCAPVITGQPVSKSLFAGVTDSFTVAASVQGSLATIPGTTLTYQWRKNGVNLSNGTGVSGATTATLTLTAVDPSDNGAYDCVVSTACGSMTSVPADLTVTSQCGSSDFNGDGDFGTDADIEAFFRVLAGGSC